MDKDLLIKFRSTLEGFYRQNEQKFIQEQLK